jgi:hypothetical protein
LILAARRLARVRKEVAANFGFRGFSAFGARLPKCPARSFHKRASEHMPEALRPALGSIFLEQIGSLTERIREYERQLETICKEHYYPETELLRQPGRGSRRAHSAHPFVLTLEDPYRFEKSRCVGAYPWGLCPPATSREIEILRDTSPRRAMRC